VPRKSAIANTDITIDTRMANAIKMDTDIDTVEDVMTKTMDIEVNDRDIRAMMTMGIGREDMVMIDIARQKTRRRICPFQTKKSLLVKTQSTDQSLSREILG